MTWGSQRARTEEYSQGRAVHQNTFAAGYTVKTGVATASNQGASGGGKVAGGATTM